MLLDAMATSGVNKLARESGLTAAQQEVEKGRVQGELRVQISLSSHCCLKDHPMGLTVGNHGGLGLFLIPGKANFGQIWLIGSALA